MDEQRQWIKDPNKKTSLSKEKEAKLRKFVNLDLSHRKERGTFIMPN